MLAFSMYTSTLRVHLLHIKVTLILSYGVYTCFRVPVLDLRMVNEVNSRHITEVYTLFELRLNSCSRPLPELWVGHSILPMMC